MAEFQLHDNPASTIFTPEQKARALSQSSLGAAGSSRQRRHASASRTSPAAGTSRTSAGTASATRARTAGTRRTSPRAAAGASRTSCPGATGAARALRRPGTGRAGSPAGARHGRGRPRRRGLLLALHDYGVVGRGGDEGEGSGRSHGTATAGVGWTGLAGVGARHASGRPRSAGVSPGEGGTGARSAGWARGMGSDAGARDWGGQTLLDGEGCQKSEDDAGHGFKIGVAITWLMGVWFIESLDARYR